MKKLTPKQEQTLSFVALHIEKHGYPPSLRDICAEFRLAGYQAAHDRIRMLVRRGALTKSPVIARGIAITEAGRAALRGIEERRQLE